MNPLTNVRNIAKLNENELKKGLFDHNKSWHAQYKDSAYIFIGGLPYDLTEGDILCVFSQYGEIVNLNLVRDKKTGKSKGFAFLCYEDQRSTILAVDNFNSIKLGGRTIRVDHVSEYRVPKSDEKDEDGNFKDKVETGCAPKTPSPVPSDNEDDGLLLDYKAEKKKKKKEKKREKKREKDQDKMSDSEIDYRKQKYEKRGKEQGDDRDQRKQYSDVKNGKAPTTSRHRHPSESPPPPKERHRQTESAKLSKSIPHRDNTGRKRHDISPRRHSRERKSPPDDRTPSKHIQHYRRNSRSPSPRRKTRDSSPEHQRKRRHDSPDTKRRR